MSAMACQSTCLSIPSDSGETRAVDPQQSLQPLASHVFVPLRAALRRLCVLQLAHWVWENDGFIDLFVIVLSVWLPLALSDVFNYFRRTCFKSVYLYLIVFPTLWLCQHFSIVSLPVFLRVCNRDKCYCRQGMGILWDNVLIQLTIDTCVYLLVRYGHRLIYSWCCSRYVNTSNDALACMSPHWCSFQDWAVDIRPFYPVCHICHHQTRVYTVHADLQTVVILFKTLLFPKILNTNKPNNAMLTSRFRNVFTREEDSSLSENSEQKQIKQRHVNEKI